MDYNINLSLPCTIILYKTKTAQPITPASTAGTLTASAASVKIGNPAVEEAPVPVGSMTVTFDGEISVGTGIVTPGGRLGTTDVVASVGEGTTGDGTKLLRSMMLVRLSDDVGRGGGGGGGM
jgi:hypothetical protein